jgi:hypothetical protein
MIPLTIHPSTLSAIAEYTPSPYSLLDMLDVLCVWVKAVGVSG